MSLNVPLLRDWVILAFNVFSCYLSSELFWPVNFFKVTGPSSVIGSSTPDRATRSSSTSTCSRWRETQQVWCDIDLDRNEPRLLRGHMDLWLSKDCPHGLIVCRARLPGCCPESLAMADHSQDSHRAVRWHSGLLQTDPLRDKHPPALLLPRRQGCRG